MFTSFVVHLRSLKAAPLQGMGQARREDGWCSSGGEAQ